MADLSLIDKAIIAVYKGIDKSTPWHKLLLFLGEFNLLAFLLDLRTKFCLTPSLMPVSKVARRLVP